MGTVRISTKDEELDLPLFHWIPKFYKRPFEHSATCMLLGLPYGHRSRLPNY